MMGSTAPTHYLKCDGTVYNISAYPVLAKYFETQFGSKNYFGGNGTTTFAVPNVTGNPPDMIFCIAVQDIFLNAPGMDLSTEEQVVGSFVDGSTIYQKVFAKTFSFNSAGLDVLTAAEVTACAIDRVVAIDFIGSDGQCCSYDYCSLTQSGTLYARSSGVTITVNYVKVQYTKTTT